MAAAQPRILMCPPTHYGIEYEINPWMNQQRVVDHPLAVRQWERLRETLAGLGVQIELLEPVAGLPDLVFTANAAMIFENRAILSRFRHPQRQGEEPHDARWLEAHGFQVLRMPDDCYFEGAGDALFCGETLFAGYRIRSHAAAMQAVGGLIQRRVIPVELIDPHFYHLDTCFCPLRAGTAIWYPEAFDDYGQRAIREAIPELLEAQEAEARQFGCNAVVVGRHVVLNAGCPQLEMSLQQIGYQTHPTPLGEFVKAGGSAKCLTLRLDGEEATRG